jgi:hypothetical protein
MIMLIYGQQVCPHTGPIEAKNGRLTIHQVPRSQDGHVYCQLFGPIEIINMLASKLGLCLDPNSDQICLLFHGSTLELIETLAPVCPDIELIDSARPECIHILADGEVASVL